MCLNPLYIKKQHTYVPCNKCVECAIQYSNVWSYRCMLESTLHKDNCFITLTYNEDNLPVGASLKKRDFQLFMKRLRKYLSRFAIKIRFFACGEYGKKHNRPHYHAIIFGWQPADLIYYKTDKKGEKLYLSDTLAKIWDKGFISVGSLSLTTCKYCAKYMTKALDFNKGVEKPFTLMSNKPGIGLNAVNWQDVLATDKIYFNGHYIITPRYYLEHIRKMFFNGENIYNDIKINRKDKFLTLFDEVLQKIYQDDSLYQWYLSNMTAVDTLIDIEELALEERRKRYKKIFGKNLDKNFRLVYYH